MVGDDEFEQAVAEAVATSDAEHKLAALVRLRHSVIAERRTLRVLTVIAIIVGCVGIFLSVSARGTAEQAHDALEVMEASRQDARVVSCESYNTDVVDKINGIMVSVASQSDDPDAAFERVEPLLLDRRDCSDKGIEDYFDGDDATNPFVPVTIP